MEKYSNYTAPCFWHHAGMVVVNFYRGPFFKTTIMTPESLKQWADDHFREYGTPLPEAFTKMPYTNNPQFKAEQYASSQYEVNQYTEPDSVKGTGWTNCRDAWLEGYNADRWIPVSELPKYSGHYYVTVTHYDGRTYCDIYSFDYDLGSWINDEGMQVRESFSWKPTHWQPLPTLPKTPTL